MLHFSARKSPHTAIYILCFNYSEPKIAKWDVIRGQRGTLIGIILDILNFLLLIVVKASWGSLEEEESSPFRWVYHSNHIPVSHQGLIGEAVRCESHDPEQTHSARWTLPHFTIRVFQHKNMCWRWIMKRFVLAVKGLKNINLKCLNVYIQYNNLCCATLKLLWDAAGWSRSFILNLHPGWAFSCSLESLYEAKLIASSSVLCTWY